MDESDSEKEVKRLLQILHLLRYFQVRNHPHINLIIHRVQMLSDMLIKQLHSITSCE
jgi:hypothetical protein